MGLMSTPFTPPRKQSGLLPVGLQNAPQTNRPYPVSRRGFLERLSLASMSAAIGSEIVFADRMPQGLIPVALAQGAEGWTVPGKDGLSVMNDRPLVAETPAHLLDDAITPAKHLFIRNNGLAPAPELLNADTWTLEIAGESCERPTTFTLKELKEKFTHHTLQMVLECAGNGRSEFNPPAKGNQWTTGGVGCPKWTGIRLADVLKHCGIKTDAVYIGYYGAERASIGRSEEVGHLARCADCQGAGGRVAAGLCHEWRGYPFAKWAAVAPDVWRLGGLDLRQMGEENRHPRPRARRRKDDGPLLSPAALSCGPGHDGAGGGHGHHRGDAGEVAHHLSQIRHHASAGRKLAVRGQAWVGEEAVASVAVSIDFGSTWVQAELDKPVNRYAWQQWRAQLTLPERATMRSGRARRTIRAARSQWCCPVGIQKVT